MQSVSWDEMPRLLLHLWNLLQQKGNIPAGEMYRVFNMGVGMIAVADKTKAAEIQKWIPERTFVIGGLVEDNNKVQFVN